MEPEKIKGFVNVFKAFDQVVQSCYHKTLAEDYKGKILEFHHIPEFCDKENGTHALE